MLRLSRPHQLFHDQNGSNHFRTNAKTIRHRSQTNLQRRNHHATTRQQQSQNKPPLHNRLQKHVGRQRRHHQQPLHRHRQYTHQCHTHRQKRYQRIIRSWQKNTWQILYAEFWRFFQVTVNRCMAWQSLTNQKYIRHIITKRIKKPLKRILQLSNDHRPQRLLAHPSLHS